jgi:hypothetical protein
MDDVPSYNTSFEVLATRVQSYALSRATRGTCTKRMTAAHICHISNLHLRTVCTTRRTPKRPSRPRVAKGTPRVPSDSVRTGRRFCRRKTTAPSFFCCESAAGDRNPSRRFCRRKTTAPAPSSFCCESAAGDRNLSQTNLFCWLSLFVVVVCCRCLLSLFVVVVF